MQNGLGKGFHTLASERFHVCGRNTAPRQHGEFIPAETRGKTVLWHKLAQPLCRLDDHCVTRAVPELIIDTFELIQIQKYDGCVGSRARIDHRHELALKGLAIGKPA